MTFCDVLRGGRVTESMRSTRVAALLSFAGCTVRAGMLS
jgi:hypothetical protein